MAGDDVLLPRQVLPVRYEISLEPDLIACTFAGSVKIEVDVKDATKAIVLHTHQLAIKEASFTGSDGKKLAPESLSFNLKAQTLTTTFGALLPNGKGTFDLAFSGTLNDELAGFYRSKYTLRGEQKWAAVTQFEATDARRCFPCFDQPDFKAVFGITVTAPADRVVLSNGHALRVSTSADGKKKTHVFADTQVMSSYLVAIVVGEFDHVSAVHPESGILTSVYTPVGCAGQGDFALKVGVDALHLLSKLFGLPYMGGMKCDHIAIADFAAGAMENTGCITYREAALLIDPAASSLAMKQRVAQVVSHELTHQWFGNWTTMKWWDNLWLNEGFAKHCEYAVTDRLFPQWDTWSIFTSSIQSNAFGLDSMASTHPIQVAVRSPEEINEIFDTISYQKGASVIRMMFTWLGYDIGWAGLHEYLTAHKFANTVTEDLWSALTKVSGKPVSAVMRRWTESSGYPYLHVSLGADGKVNLQSKRHIAAWARNKDAWPTDGDFSSGPGLQAASAAAGKLAVAPKDDKDRLVNYNEDWCLPVSVVTGTTGAAGQAKYIGVLALDSEAWRDPSLSTGPKDREGQLAAMASALSTAMQGNGYMKVNAGHGAFFRTHYGPELLARLEPACATPKDRKSAPALGTTDRLGLIGDVASGVAVGVLSSTALLSFLRAFRYESDYNVWVAVLDALGDVKSAAEALPAPQQAEAVSALNAYTVDLLGPIVELVGWEPKADEHSNTPLLRAMVLRQAALAGSKAVVDECLTTFDAYAAGKGIIIADLKQLVYNTAAQCGGESRWQALYKLFKGASTSEEQRRLMTALGRASDSSLLSKALNMVLSDEVRSQDSAIIISAVASNPGDAGRRLAWGWLKSNWDAQHKRLGGGFMVWAGMVGAAIRHFDAKADADDIEAWFTSHPAGAAERTVKQAMERIRTAAWRAHVLAREPGGIAKGVAGLVGNVPAYLQ